ncbi:glycosyltransferase [Nocardioides caeni]|uniref:Glycosyltransferase n=1 Tax=Nocardioides caeni TaxID=574700 RepID=A0A4S8NAK8_9ACTN|nr:glycosyltransferase [Nocardioides caeni]THV12961.1 glycosyltransferase [Nocardioides caeni]
MNFDELEIAAIVPCHNEELTVAAVVRDLRAALPSATIYVYDNNSTDRTAEVAAEAGAVVRSETRKGKGNVVRRAFADIEADVYLMIDGDDTYDAAAAPQLVEKLVSGPYDHVVGCRVDTQEESSYRPGHAWGNKMFNRVTSMAFGEPVSDMLSGYRAFSRRYIKSFPANSEEFEIETELTIHAANLRVPQAEVAVGFKDRPEGSESKLNTFSDGFKILGLLGHLLLHERPLLVFGLISLLSTLVGLGLGLPVVADYLRTGEVDRFPTAILASSLVLIGVLLMGVGMVLNGVLRGRQEVRRLFYLQLPAAPRP